jgi:hypothetical protein
VYSFVLGGSFFSASLKVGNQVVSNLGFGGVRLVSRVLCTIDIIHRRTQSARISFESTQIYRLLVYTQLAAGGGGVMAFVEPALLAAKHSVALGPQSCCSFLFRSASMPIVGPPRRPVKEKSVRNSENRSES